MSNRELSQQAQPQSGMGPASGLPLLSDLFPFRLDDFQLASIDALNRGHSVVVSAPTGSGKTLIGEYAIHRALSHNQRVFYTTPLKALSNQKLRDFRQQFGAERVGLMTGDLSVNREAPIVVMTTEIFRNMLYAEIDADEREQDPLTDVEAVVLDECHYMNDSQRGTVWEESVIHCPASVQLVGLSATVANAGQLTDWIERVHGPCTLVVSDFRPVPLAFDFCSAKGLHPLLDEAGKGLHPNCRIWRAPKGHRRRGRSPRPPQPEPPPLGFVVGQLVQRDMLPAIYFIFSRKGCDRGVRELGNACLVSPGEQRQIRARLERFVAESPEAVRDGIHADALLRGIGAHHAGVLPAWKELIEELFQTGVIKVVFATETLAAGINMPARTTVISSLSKRTENGHRPLMASEFLQMAGRAGRRGKDTQGFVVTVQSRFEGVREAGQLAISPPDPLVSQFTPSYGMVLNLLQRYDLDKAKELVERSFGRYLASLDLEHDRRQIASLEARLADFGDFGSVDWEALDRYEQERKRLRDARRQLRALERDGAQPPGDGDSGGPALAVSHPDSEQGNGIPRHDLAAALVGQNRLVLALEEALTQHPAHRWRDRRQLRKQRRRMEELRQEIDERQRIMHRRSNHHWDIFLALVEILRHFGCLDDLEPTEIGRTVAALRGDNELWLGLALMSGHLDGLEPAELAAVLEAISTEVNRPDLRSDYAVPPQVEEALGDIRGLRRQLMRQQQQRDVVMPLWWEPELTGLVHAWARGERWNQLIRHTSLDEGDVVRLLRRTVDLLAQLPYCPAISDQLRRKARRAMAMINRFPVQEASDLNPGPGREDDAGTAVR